MLMYGLTVKIEKKKGKRYISFGADTPKVDYRIIDEL